jgi:hypothetical protein
MVIERSDVALTQHPRATVVTQVRKMGGVNESSPIA